MPRLAQARTCMPCSPPCPLLLPPRVSPSLPMALSQLSRVLAIMCPPSPSPHSPAIICQAPSLFVSVPLLLRVLGPAITWPPFPGLHLSQVLLDSPFRLSRCCQWYQLPRNAPPPPPFLGFISQVLLCSSLCSFLRSRCCQLSRGPLPPAFISQVLLQPSLSLFRCCRCSQAPRASPGLRLLHFLKCPSLPPAGSLSSVFVLVHTLQVLPLPSFSSSVCIACSFLAFGSFLTP